MLYIIRCVVLMIDPSSKVHLSTIQSSIINPRVRENHWIRSRRRPRAATSWQSNTRELALIKTGRCGHAA